MFRFLKMFLKFLLSLPKTVYFNLRYLPLKQAVKLPILITYNTKTLISKTGKLKIEGEIKPFMIKYNFGEGSEGVEIGRGSQGFLKIGDDASLILKGKASFQKGISVRCGSGKLIIGRNFFSNKYCFISCTNTIIIDDDVLFGWNVEVKDGDGHKMIGLDEENKQIKEDLLIKIGKNAWLSGNVKVMKNVNIPSNSVVGYNSCVLKPLYEENVLIAGYPAEIKKRNIFWER